MSSCEASCPECARLSTTLAPGLRAECSLCGTEWEAWAPSPRRPLQRPPRRADVLGAMLRDLDAIRRWRLSVEVATASPSALGGILDAARSGFVGNGCKGSVPLGSGRSLETLSAPRPQPAELRRYYALSGLPFHRVREWLLARLRRGNELPVVRFGERTPHLSLAQLAGLELGPEEDRSRWAAYLAAGDSDPATLAAGAEGKRLLEGAAEEWASGRAALALVDAAEALEVLRLHWLAPSYCAPRLPRCEGTAASSEACGDASERCAVRLDRTWRPTEAEWTMLGPHVRTSCSCVKESLRTGRSWALRACSVCRGTGLAPSLTPAPPVL